MLFSHIFKLRTIIIVLGIVVGDTAVMKMSPYSLHKVFVYGTLKKGEPNHQWFSSDTEGFHQFLYDAKTTEKYPLIIGTKYNIPFVLNSPGHGTYIKGEVYEVDDKVLAKLDILEDHPNYYIRDLYDIQPLDGKNERTKAWIYVIKNFKKELLNETFYESYSNSGSHGKKYVESEDSSLDDL